MLYADICGLWVFIQFYRKFMCFLGNHTIVFFRYFKSKYGAISDVNFQHSVSQKMNIYAQIFKICMYVYKHTRICKPLSSFNVKCLQRILTEDIFLKLSVFRIFFSHIDGNGSIHLNWKWDTKELLAEKHFLSEIIVLFSFSTILKKSDGILIFRILV